MGHKRLMPVDVVLKVMNFPPAPAGQYGSNIMLFQRDMLPARRGEE